MKNHNHLSMSIIRSIVCGTKFAVCGFTSSESFNTLFWQAPEPKERVYNLAREREGQMKERKMP